MPIILIVNLFATESGLTALQKFESKVLPVLESHGGRLISAFTPTPPHDQNQPVPDEVHILAFPSAGAFDAYRRDPVHTKLANERDTAIRHTEIAWSGTPVSYSDRTAAK